MAKERCIWHKEFQRVKFLDGTEKDSTYEQMISAGWEQSRNDKGELAEGQFTIIFEKSACNPETNVHTDSE